MIIQGSGTLDPQLLRAGLVDRLILMTFPLTLGPGKRWFRIGWISRAAVDSGTDPGFRYIHNELMSHHRNESA